MFLTIVLQTSLSLVTFMSFVIVISAGSLNTSSFTLPLRSFSMTFKQVVFVFPLFLFVVLSASCNYFLAGVSGGSLMRWTSQFRRLLLFVLLNGSTLVISYSFWLDIFLGHLMLIICLNIRLWEESILLAVFDVWLRVVLENRCCKCFESSQFGTTQYWYVWICNFAGAFSYYRLLTLFSCLCLSLC